MGEAVMVPVIELRHWWGEVREFILSAERRWKTETEEQIVASLLQDRYKLGVVCEEGRAVGAFTVEIVELPEVRVAVIRQLGGNFPKMWENKDYFLSWLRAFGAERLMMSGRRGWARKLKSLGFTERFVTMEVHLGRWG